MKYIMFKVKHATGLDQLVPIIFPDQLVHKFVAEAIASHKEMRDLEMEPVSAGQCGIDCAGTYGNSETLKLQSNPKDAVTITTYDYMHGL